jgi:hypothetical protein
MSIGAIGSSGGFDVSQMASKIVKDFDKNSDGSIDKSEFTSGLVSKGMSEEDAAKKFDSIDTQKTGKISQGDIEADLKANVKNTSGHSGPPPSGGAGKAGGTTQGSNSKTYDAKDTNKDGTVSAMEELIYEIKNSSKEGAKVSDASTTESINNSSKQKIGSIVDVTV